MIVGVAGAIGSGKDTMAAHLVARYGFVRRGLADALKDEVATRLRRTLEAHIHQTFSGGLIERLGMDALIHRVLWEDRTPVTRALLQEWGTELRRAEDPDYWTRQLVEYIRARRLTSFVIPDVRFLNEVAAVRSLGGLLVLVRRPGHEGAGHASETSLRDYTDWDGVLRNDGSVADLHARVEAWMASLPTMDTAA